MVFMVLYYHDHAQLRQLQHPDSGSKFRDIDHRQRLARRRAQLQETSVLQF